MQIVYIAGCYSNKTHEWCREQFPKLPHLPGQKFHKLLLEGFVKNSIQSVHVIADLPVISRVSEDIDLGYDEENGVVYHYLKCFRGRYNTLRKALQYKKQISDLLKKESDSVVVCDVLKPSTVIPVLKTCKEFGIKCYGVATDIPHKRAENGNIRTRLANLLGEKLIDKFDGYIFLTEAMNDLVNHNKKPYTIIECLVDTHMQNVVNEIENKKTPRVCLYAGGIRSIYGIPEMVQGFIEADIPDAELHIYGSGDYCEELINVCKTHGNVKYYGIVSNDTVVKEEITATLLVNPRPAGGEYTKYSFPSKNMEYMASGTPLLGVRLYGIPNEYFDYMYTVDDVDTQSFARIFNKLLSLDKAELHAMGMSAKEFVLREKSNYKQAKKVIDLLRYGSKHNSIYKEV